MQSIQCPHCGTQNSPLGKFCGICGQALQGPAILAPQIPRAVDGTERAWSMVGWGFATLALALWTGALLWDFAENLVLAKGGEHAASVASWQMLELPVLAAVTVFCALRFRRQFVYGNPGQDPIVTARRRTWFALAAVTAGLMLTLPAWSHYSRMLAARQIVERQEAEEQARARARGANLSEWIHRTDEQSIPARRSNPFQPVQQPSPSVPKTLPCGHLVARVVERIPGSAGRPGEIVACELGHQFMHFSRDPEDHFETVPANLGRSGASYAPAAQPIKGDLPPSDFGMVNPHGTPYVSPPEKYRGGLGGR